MREQLNKPKRFGEILDAIFTLSRRYFIDFVKVFFIIIGPIYILQAVIQLMGGVSFFRNISHGTNWLEGIVNSFTEEDILMEGFDNTIYIGLFALIFMVVAQIAVLYAVDHIRRGEEFVINDIIKKAFSRFFPLLGGGIILFIFAFIAIFIFTIVGVIIGTILATASPVLTVLFAIPFVIGVMVLIAFLAVKFSFYAAEIAFGKRAFSSLGASWNLTKGRFWIILGIYLIFSVIIGTVSSVFEMVFGIALGNSVLFGLIINTVTLVTSMIAAVGYSVVYFDLYVRHDSTDLKEMISQYDEETE